MTATLETTAATTGTQARAELLLGLIRDAKTGAEAQGARAELEELMAEAGWGPGMRREAIAYALAMGVTIVAAMYACQTGEAAALPQPQKGTTR